MNKLCGLINWELESGPKSNFCNRFKFNYYETELVKNINSCDSYLVSFLLAKFRNNNKTEKQYYAYAFASMYFIPYINWIIKNAIEKNYKILYFMDKEGEFLKKITDEIIKINNINLKTKYIYVTEEILTEINEIEFNTEQKRNIIKKYLQQEINFSEKFAFIKYIGKDSMQECLTNLINEISEEKINIPYYYASSIYPTIENSIKYDFSINFKLLCFIDTIFLNLYYEDVEKYEIQENTIIPIINKKNIDEEFYDNLYYNIIEFYNDFNKLVLKDREKIERELFDFSLKYFNKNSNDKFITYNMGDLIVFDDNGKRNIYAPPIKIKDLFSEIFLNKSFKDKTQNIQMSLKRSSKRIKKYYIFKENCTLNASKKKNRRKKHIKKIKRKIKKKIFSYIMILLNRIFTLLYKLDENSVLFLSDVREELGGNLLFIYNKIPNQYNKLLYLKSDRRVRRSYKEKIKLLKDLSRSKYIILDDFSISISHLKVRRKQEIVQLWHGPGAFKTFGYSRIDKKNKYYLHRNYTKAIVTSEKIKWCYAEGFGMDEKNIYATGFPRTDIFFDEKYLKDTREKIYEQYPFIKNKKVILFAPTYRGKNLKVASYDFEQLDLEKIYQNLKDDYVFIFKWHPAIYNNLMLGKIKFDYSNYKDFYYDFSDYRDINDILLVTDILITDYSSVIFDYLLVNKPIVYFTYDLEEYESQRGLYFPFNDYIYGDVAYNCDQLIEAIKHENLDEDKRQKFNEQFMNACDGKSTDKVYDLIFGNNELKKNNEINKKTVNLTTAKKF